MGLYASLRVQPHSNLASPLELLTNMRSDTGDRAERVEHPNQNSSTIHLLKTTETTAAHSIRGGASQPVISEATQLADGGFVFARNLERGSESRSLNGSCPRNRTYDKLLRLISTNLYDPEALAAVPPLLDKYNCRIKNDADAISFAQEAVDSLGDPYTKILDASETKELLKMIDGTDFGGIGVVIEPTVDQSGTRIVRVIPETPAEKVGLRAGDLIVKVNNVDVSLLDQDKVSDLVKGRPGTDVSLLVYRAGEKKSFTATRAMVSPPVVDEKRLEGDIAYIGLSTFMNGNAAEQVKKALLRQDDARGYILDFRNNSGGLVDQALKVASMFVGDGTLVSMRSRIAWNPSKSGYSTLRYNVSSQETDGVIDHLREESNKRWFTHFAKEKDIVDKPVVILVNEGTASASELTAAALHDNGAATIIGTKTLGKGVSQDIIPTGNVAVKVTSSRYFTPKGVWLGDGHRERIGITPDIEVSNPRSAQAGTETDLQLKRALEFLHIKMQ